MTPEEFKSIRKKLGLTQAELASLIEVSPRTIQGWEYGKQKISKPVEEFLKRRIYNDQSLNNDGSITLDVKDKELISLEEMATFCLQHMDEFEKLPLVQMFINYHKNQAKTELLEKHIILKSKKEN
ncbi:helix-turn-helix domain-containing protein [Aquimarina rhabdastrellae]